MNIQQLRLYYSSELSTFHMVKKPYSKVFPHWSVSIAICVNSQQVLEANVAQRHRFSAAAGIIAALSLEDWVEVSRITLAAKDAHSWQWSHDKVLLSSSFCIYNWIVLEPRLQDICCRKSSKINVIYRRVHSGNTCTLKHSLTSKHTDCTLKHCHSQGHRKVSRLYEKNSTS